MSCGWAGKQPWTRAARRQSGYPAQSARQVPALLGTFALLLGTPEAHMMKPAEHASAVRSLRECATTVADKEGRRYWWRVTSTVMPQLPAGCWYLHMGSSAVPRGLMQLVTDPDGQPAGDRAPKSQELLGYSGSGDVVWYHHAAENLLHPSLKAIVPRRLVRHARWDAASGTIQSVAARSGCEGRGYPDSTPDASTSDGPDADVRMQYENHCEEPKV